VEAIAREESYLMSKSVKPPEPIECSTLEIIFTLSSKRVRDLDGLLGACKPWIDGLVDAGVLLKDDCWHLQKIAFWAEYKKGEEGTEFIITALPQVDDIDNFTDK
jgi:hypothetical protein